MMVFRLLVIVALLVNITALGNAEAYTTGQKTEQDFTSFAQPFLESHCIDCHSHSDPEAGLSLEELGPIDQINAAVWRSVWAQVSLGEMPPKDASAPEVVERLQFTDWVVGQLTDAMHEKGGFHDHLDPNKGNFLDHDLLFGPLPQGIKLVPASSPARIWRVTPQEHITRLNELINTEPQFDPEKPGLRTHGDAVPTNHGGELKLYFGADRIIKWQGGTVAYATSVKSVPAVLSSARDHGLENYPDFYTVNSAEATQIMGIAGDILRYMAEGPLSIANPEQITDDPDTYEMVGDIRGLPTALVYSTKVVRPLTPVYDLMKEDVVTEERLLAAVNFLFEALTFRQPTKSESDAYLAILKQSVDQLGKDDGVLLGLSAIFLDRDALFRPELVQDGSQDAFGRVMLQDSELGLAINHALKYIKPDKELQNAVTQGRLRTRADVRREVERMLADDSIRKPRVLQFFRDYFDYDQGGYICKDAKSLADTGASNRGAAHYRAMFDAVASTDRLVELILKEDTDVLSQLLTTDKVVASNSDKLYFGRQRTKEERAESTAEAEKKAAASAKAESAALESAEQELAELEKFLNANPTEEKANRKELTAKKRAVTTAQKKLDAATKKKRNDANHSVAMAELPRQDYWTDRSGANSSKIFARVSHRSFGNGSLKPDRFLATAPEGQRLGILTHPSWLVSHSDAMDNHAIRRGRWVRERLLGGGIPDVPITVDAMLPDEPDRTLRERMRVTREDYCTTCHRKMDPLGLPFEMFNHAGIYREFELGIPVETSGAIIDSGDPDLDGEVANAIELIQKLAESERVEQVFVRHAFRFWMGRNETINDAPVLQDAHRAYKESGGSMNALLTSLLTSDAFLYRVRS